MFPIVVLLGLTGLVAAVLQASGEFGATAFAPVLWNIVIIVGPGRGDADRPRRASGSPSTPSRSWSGTTVQLLYLLPSLRGKGPFPFSLGIGNRAVRRVLVLMLPGDARAGADQRQPARWTGPSPAS